jgi:hypothetical protein
MRRPGLQYSTVSVRKAKYTRLGYRTRLSRLHTLDPPFSINFFKEQPFNINFFKEQPFSNTRH